MDAQGYDVPKSTPPKGRYALIEKQFLTEAWKHEKTPAKLVTQVTSDSNRYKQSIEP